MERLLELLKGAGLDVGTLGDDTSGLEAALRELFKPSDSGGSEAEALRARLEEAEKKAEETFRRLQGQDSAISKKDVRIKELEELLEAKVPERQFPSRQQAGESQALEQLRAAYDAKLDEISRNVAAMLENDAQRQARLEAAEAELRHTALISDLEKKFPVVSQFRDLVPKTADKVVLEKWAAGLSDFAKSVEAKAYENVRQGHIPPSNPPNIGPGKNEEFIREMDLIDAQVKAGDLTVSQGQAKLQALAAMMKPE